MQFLLSSAHAHKIVTLSNRRVIPPQLSLYMALAPEQKLTYPLAGPSGPAAFAAGKQGFEAQSFRGLGVFTSTPVSFVLEPHIEP